MQWKQDISPGFGSLPYGFNCAIDFIPAGHEYQNVATGMGCVLRERVGGEIPDGWRVLAKPSWQIVNCYGKSSALRGQDGARRKVLLERACRDRGGHHNDEQVWPALFLNIERTGKSDVTVQVSFVKFIED